MIRLVPRALAVTALVASVCGPARAQDRRPMAVEDFLSLRIASDPQLAPDGRHVAFTVTVPSLEDDRNVSRVWLLDLGSGASRELTAGAGSDHSPRWGPDGRTLGFISTRSGSPQVWRIRTDGGEPVRLTQVPNGVAEFYWSPDTTGIYVVSDVSWPADQELARRHGEYPTKARLWTDLLYRHWNEWRAGVRRHVLRVGLPGGELTDVTPLDRDVPTLALGGSDVAVSPLGTELAVVMNPDSTVALSTNNEIFLMGPDGTGLVKMTANPGNDHSPAYSPNARWIAYLATSVPGFESDRQRIMLYDRANGDHQELTGDWDRSVSALRWMPDSRAIIATVEERGRQNLYRIGVPEGDRTLLVEGGTSASPQATLRGDTLLFVHHTASRPPDLYLLPLDGRSQPQALTSLNATALAGLALSPLESFTFAGARGDSVQGWLMKPPGFSADRRYPLVYLVHGGPQGAWLDSWHPRWNFALFAARGYVVAGVNFHGSTGYGQAFTNSISREWGSLPYEDLMKGLDHLSREPWIEGSLVGAAGASYGGYMIYWMAGQTNRFRALVAHDGVYNLVSMAGTTEELWFPGHEFGGQITDPEARALLERWSPANHITKWTTPILIIHGQEDFRVDVSEGLQAFTAAKLRGVPARFLYFPDEGHFVLKPRNRRLWWGVVLDWLDQHLKQPAP